MTTQYAGIDYSLGRSNVDSTGIHYGVIAQNSCNCESVDDIYTNGEDLALAKALGELRVRCGDDDERLERETQAMFDCWETLLSNIEYNKDGYLITGCLDFDLFILKSPFYTFAQFCSPCVPGAGNLDCPCETGPKTYCLGHDWFDDGKAPYPVYSVATNELVTA